ncbi:ABC-ATPase UvrA [Dictyobacter sp. S3.2.2.5]|uniref:UvrABC system protein A n=1 Tax=Dictyobacter halimunensis TaxID=3026934 RepID=A0ABQ6FK07_9CHLR|nr:ABC-ATPase UvrA [Dictyobacter sp. S3.2.2.5]
MTKTEAQFPTVDTMPEDIRSTRGVRRTIAIKGASEHNLQKVSVEIPRDCLVVFTGMSGSGKSSLAFDTIYAEGQRLLLESLSSFTKRFVDQLKKPSVELILGLSPVVSIEQKTTNKNPRSTVGTLTDIYDYIRVLFSITGQAHCPYCGRSIPVKTAVQIVEHLLALPEGSTVEIAAPVYKIYGEDYGYLFGDIRSKGYRHVRINGELYDLSEEIELDEGREYEVLAIIDRPVIKKTIEKQLRATVTNGLRVGEGFLRFRILKPAKELPEEQAVRGLDASFCCPEHQTTMGELLPYYFSFNEADSACVTCLGLGTYLKVHPDLLVPDKKRSIAQKAFIPEAFTYDKNTWMGRIVYSLGQHYGFSMDTPFEELPPEAVDILFYGTKGEKFPIVLPEGATKGDQHVGKPFRFDGIINSIERRYKHYRQKQVAHSGMETYLRRVMVEHNCPDCQGKRLKRQRLLVTLNGTNIYELGEMNLSELSRFMANLPPITRQREAGEQVLAEIKLRLRLLVGIGLDYLNLNRRSATLSGGEYQRLRLSTQISSGLMGMLYVLDEPSIGLHPRDNFKMIATLKQLRDIGNSVIVVEHDEDTIRAADHIIEMGPGAGIHGGHVVAQGTPPEVLQNPDSLTGQFLSGRREIKIPEQRRQPNGVELVIRGARQNNLKNIDVHIPLGVLVCITGVSGSGKSTLVNEILFKKLASVFHDSRIIPGKHETIEGIEHLRDMVNIDQSPIGRLPTSTPATYIGVYDHIRHIFAGMPEAQARGYTTSQFSFNVKGGRCEECSGQGLVTTQLHFMPDVEAPCRVCNGARYNQETLEVKYHGKSIADVLDLSVEESVVFFEDHPLITHKLGMLNQLGLGYLKLGQSSTTLSGGEAQRVKLAYELSKVKRGGKNLYILDEPTTGLHLADIQHLLESLNRLVDGGHTVLVIEHHLDVIKTADTVIDLGPEGGERGGEILCQGTPEEIAACPQSYTGQFLKEKLRSH